MKSGKPKHNNQEDKIPDFTVSKRVSKEAYRRQKTPLASENMNTSNEDDRMHLFFEAFAQRGAEHNKSLAEKRRQFRAVLLSEERMSAIIDKNFSRLGLD
jgi:hypothetical protein